MNRKSNLLSIGEISKLTGAGIKSLRYYERINILKPAYVSPDTGYRYYTVDQIYLVEMIRFCIELDIPLAEMTNFIDQDGVMDFRKFFREGREVAEKKIKALKKGLKLISNIERQMDLSEQFQLGQIYTCEMPEKVFHVKPCGKSLENINIVEIVKSFSEMLPIEDDYEMCEYGFLCTHSPDETIYYSFLEVPKNLEMESTIVIPKGTYLFIQSEDYKIEQACDIFKEHIDTEKPFLAIETEIITGRHKVSKPIKELRVFATHKTPL